MFTLEMNSADGKVTERQKYSSKVGIVATMKCAFKYKMSLCDREKQFAGERKRKTKDLRVGDRCVTLFVLPN